MKILITGSTANQSNPVTHERSTNFAGLIRDSLERSGVDVMWQDPDTSATKSDFDQYDKVLVGISSPMALGANRIYGALNTVNVMWNDPRLALLLDAPDPNNISRGLDSINRNPKTLTKDFFQYRKGYEWASTPQGKAHTLGACERLRNDKWPATIAPAFPWSRNEQFERALPSGASDQLRLLNLDRMIIRKFEKQRPEKAQPREERWMAERGADKAWLKRLEVKQPVFSLKTDHRTDLHPYTLSRLQTATGLLHSPTKRGTVWWSPKVALSLSQRTPIFTHWADERPFDISWAISPKTFEILSQEEQREFALHQYDVYTNAIPSGGQISEYLFKALELDND